MRTRSRLLVVLAALLAGPAARGDVPAPPPDPGDSAFDPDDGFEDDVETAVASRRARRIRETPGVVTIFTREDLLASGARDLSDVLARVPGFQLGLDVASGVGAGFRGIWGHEGKILFLVDGIELNDLSYGSFQLNNHVPVDQLERVEVIRGPGSSLYGGHAELAVVNVVTRAGAVEGAGATVSGGRLSRASSGGAVTAAAGTTAAGVRVGATASAATRRWSDRAYTDFGGSRIDLADASRASPALVTARIAWRELDLRLLYDDYRTTARDGYDAVAPRDVDVRWRSAAVDARATLDLPGDLTLTPRLTYRWEQPWQAKVPDLEAYYYDVTNQRLEGRLALARDAVTGASVIAGVEAWVEQGRVNAFSNGRLSYDGKRAITHTDVAAFLEVADDTPLANLLAGARVERHSAFGSAFVPRVAVTRLLDPFHVKLLASGAFRTPSIENANGSADLRPERTWVFEAEVGFEPVRALYATANVFDVTVLRPIVFAFDGADAYTNEARTGSRGVEAELQLRGKAASASLSWSYYSARGKNRVPAFAVADDPGLLVGFAGHKVVASAELRPLRGVKIAPAVTVLSSRAAFDGSEPAGAPAAGRASARAVVDLFATWQPSPARAVELGLGVRDLLDAGPVLIQPYPGGHAPLPGAGREVWLRLRYEHR